MNPNEVRVYQLSNWEEFGLTIRNQISHFAIAYPGETIYRGHGCLVWKLSSPLERVLYEPISVGGAYKVQRDVDLERRVVNHFRNLLRGAPGVQTESLTDDELEAFGRHHGLCTALLDWTRSPYIAAYFAFMHALEANNPGLKDGFKRTEAFKLPADPVAIWGLTLASEVRADTDLVVDEWRKDAFYRQRAQQGIFTRLKSQIFADIVSYLENNGRAHYLCRIEILCSEAAKALLDLHSMNIHEASLFPDPNGAATQANLQLRWPEILSMVHQSHNSKS